MDATPFQDLSCLVVDKNTYDAKVLRGILRSIGVAKIVILGATGDALDLLRKQRFDAVFIEEKSEVENPLTFCKKMRTDLETKDPTTTVFLLCRATRRRAVELARDAGANDVICLPVSPAVVRLKLQSIVTMPKAFVASKAYLGPDRRKVDRDASPAPYNGEDRRQRAPQDVAIFTGRPRFEPN